MLPVSIIVVIVICSFVQSIFGVGLLVFGTPTLLLLGYQFTEALGFLLPCSLVISVMQAFRGRSKIVAFKYSLLLLSVPSICAGLFIIYYFSLDVNLKLLIALLMLITAFLRSSAFARKKIGLFFKKYQNIYMLAMGFIHGLTNMGGAFLTVMMSNFYQQKEDIRVNIAYGYFIFASAQLTTLFLIEGRLLALDSWFLPVIAACIYIMSELLFFKKISESVFSDLITIVTALYGVSLLYSSFS